MKKDTAAEIINQLMKPGHPVRQADVLAAGLPPGWSLDISRASQAAADGTAALLSAHDLADRLLSAGKDRAALALREAVRGGTATAKPRPAREREATPPSVTPQAQTREDRREARVQARLRNMRGIPIEGFETLDGVPVDRFDTTNPRG